MQKYQSPVAKLQNQRKLHHKVEHTEEQMAAADGDVDTGKMSGLRCFWARTLFEEKAIMHAVRIIKIQKKYERWLCGGRN